MTLGLAIAALVLSVFAAAGVLFTLTVIVLPIVRVRRAVRARRTLRA